VGMGVIGHISGERPNLVKFKLARYELEIKINKYFCCIVEEWPLKHKLFSPTT